MFKRSSIQVGVILPVFWVTLSTCYAAEPTVDISCADRGCCRQFSDAVGACTCKNAKCKACCDLHFDAGTVDPPGTLCPRYPYETFRMYYYRRPYNASHLEQHMTDTNRVNPSNDIPYASPWFSEIYKRIETESVEERLSGGRSDPETKRDLLVKDKVLEFVDWKRHRQARLQWESEQDDLSTTLRSLINAEMLEDDRQVR
ncbi:MAG: hypothetical protein KDB00_18970 [Planctomycetales bacterium]|nr:hypothetical protein [Planctomycetales bacterium]